MTSAVALIPDPEPHRHHRLILVRPGDAVGKRAWPGPTDTRPLSAKGRKQITRLARFLVGREVDVTTIVAGSEARDRETAELLGLWLERPVVVDPRIAPGITPAGLEALLDEVARRDLRPTHRQRALLVAHEPIASLLLVLLTDSPGIDLTAGGAASLRIHGPMAPGCASVGWLVVPSMLRGLRTKSAKKHKAGRPGVDERERETVLV
jgi:phosphohistidine phosphatase SixA